MQFKGYWPLGFCMTSDSLDRFAQLLVDAVRIVGDRPLDAQLERHLNDQLPPTGGLFQSIFQSCRDAIAAGWMCNRSAGGIRYGRVIKPAQQLGRF